MSEPRSSTWKAILGRFVLFALIGYAGLIAMLLLIENRLLYHPTAHWVAPPTTEIVDVHLTSADGTLLHAWWLPAKDSDLALLYCHGNAGNLSYRGGTIVKIREKLNASVLIMDYPGYGKSEGVPSEQGCYAAAEAAYDWLICEKKIAPKKLILYGSSMGGGVITKIAAEREHRALALVKTFISAPDVACDIYWWLPVPKHALMFNRFDSLSRIDQCKRPIFIAHGTADEMIPYAHGERLFKAANEPKQFLAIPAAMHNDRLPDQFYDSLNAFLRANPIE